MLWHGGYIRHKTAKKGPEIGVGGGQGGRDKNQNIM